MPSAPDILRTERLTATRLAPADADFVTAMHGDPATMTAIGGVRGPERTAIYMQDNLAHWAARGFGIYILRDPATGSPLGRAGLRTLPLAAGEEVEIAYILMPPARGRGLATEIVAGLTALARDTLGLPGLVAVIPAANAASLRVAAKAGFTFAQDIDKPAGRFQLHRLAFRKDAQEPHNP